jgi:seryl-tRNA synthetase
VIDPRLLREDPDRVRRSQRVRGDDESVVDAALAAEAARREAVSAADGLRATQKSLGKNVASAGPDERAALLEKLASIAADVKAAEAAEGLAQSTFDAAMRRIANVVEDDVPPGGEDDFVVVREVGTPRTFDFPVRDHVDLGAALGAIDVERGAKVSGARFYYLTGVGALLELALVNLAMERATAAGFVPVIAPALVKREAMEGTGFLGEHAGEVYQLPADDLYLVGTSEVALAAMHMGEILDLPDGTPRRYAGFSSCFRREAGSYGKDTRGIIRVHWFDKVEMFSFCPAEQSRDEHRRLLAWEEEMLRALELPYRVIDIAGGDLGSSAARKFDCEAWLPSQQRWLELTSTSNCTDFQARRLSVRTRAGGKPTLVHTLNGTLVAVARTIVCLLENHQQADGSVYVPVALRPFLGGREVL